MDHQHLCQPEFAGNKDGMRSLYLKLNTYPTSINGDLLLIRSHIAYHSGDAMAQRVVIKKSRGDSYRVLSSALKGAYQHIVTVTDPYDHRAGVHGWI